MLNIIELTTLEGADLEVFRVSHQTKELQREGIFVAEGEKIVRRLLDSNLTIISMLISRKWLDVFLKNQADFENRLRETPLFLVDDSAIESIVGYALHQGIMAVGKIPIDATLPDILQHANPPYLFVALDNITNTDNVGGIIRNSAAFGVHLLISGNSSASPYYRRSVRNSMGTIFRLPVMHVNNLEMILTELKTKHQFNIIAASLNGNKQLPEGNFNHHTCLIFGNENTGIGQQLLNLCSETVSIPMQNGTDSLNVANASAVFLYEAFRQRSCL